MRIRFRLTNLVVIMTMMLIVPSQATAGVLIDAVLCKVKLCVQVINGTVEGKYVYNEPPIKYVPIAVDDITVILPIENPNLVSDPGDANNQTVIGIDSDSNGIRDDVQRFIDINYWDDLIGKVILENSAVSLQNILQAPNSNQTVVNEMGSLLKVSRCFRSTHQMSASDIEAEFYSVVLNTVDRLLAWSQAQTQMKGVSAEWVDPDNYHAQCNNIN